MNHGLLSISGVVLPLALVVRLIAVVVTLGLARHARISRVVALVGSIIASGLTLTVAASVLASGAAVDGVLARHAASGIVLAYSVTPLSAWFLVTLGALAIPVAFYSIEYFAHAIPASRTAPVSAAFTLLLGAVEVVFVAGDAITFLCAWELMTLVTAALVATDHEDVSTRRAAYLYLVMSHVGTGCVIAGLLTLASLSGSLSFPVLLAGNVASGPFRDVLFGLFFFGFAVKVGVIPLHIWLPEAHSAAPSSISALMSAVLITAGVYGLVRMCAFGLGTPDVSWGLLVMAFGTLSAILGVLYALTQNDLKRLLAYSTIENAGVMLLALGAGMTALAYDRGDLAAVVVAASLYHVLNHAAFKGLLFLGAGSVLMATGSRHLETLGGLLRRMPWTGLFFLLGAMAISGLPPLNGFASEWLVFQALLLGFTAIPGLTRLNFPLAGALLALTTALAAACFVKAFGVAFLARPRGRAAEEAREVPWMMLGPKAFLAVMCLLLGLFPGTVLRVLGGVLTSLPGVPPRGDLAPTGLALASGPGNFDRLVPVTFGLALAASGGLAVFLARSRLAVRRTPTWGCGGELTARSQYTATAFSKPLMMIFRAVYRPTREVEALAEVSPYFPREVRYRASIEPTFERYIYGPLARAVLAVAHGMKVLQAGSLHAYLAYVLLLGVVLLIWLGGTT
jgi:hydrogenase-4 component B